MDFLPKSTIKGKTGDGQSFRAEVWDFSTLAQLEFMSVLITLIVSLVLCSFISPVLLLISVITFNGRNIVPNIIGILISAFFLYCAYDGGIVLSILQLVFDESSLNYIVAINIGSLVVHAYLIIFGWKLRELSLKMKNKTEFELAILTSVFIMFIVSLIAFKSIENREGWLQRNLDKDDEKPVPVRNMTDAEIEEQAIFEYEESLRKQGRDVEAMRELKRR